METTATIPEKKPRVRRMRKRTNFKHVPRPVYPIRALWQAASAEEKTRAHRTCVVILEYWLGRKAKGEAMAELGVPALRLWQISQRALSGMVVGLLKPPRARGKGPVEMTDPENDPRKLKRKIETLERRLKLAEDVIRILRDLPANRDEGTAKTIPTDPAPSGKKRRRTKTPRRAAPSDRGPAG